MGNKEQSGHRHDKIHFFINKQRHETDQTELTVRVLLVEFAHEDPNNTTLVLKHGSTLTEYTDLEEVVLLKNGMHFVVFDETPTPVS